MGVTKSRRVPDPPPRSHFSFLATSMERRNPSPCELPPPPSSDSERRKAMSRGRGRGWGLRNRDESLIHFQQITDHNSLITLPKTFSNARTNAGFTSSTVTSLPNSAVRLVTP